MITFDEGGGYYDSGFIQPIDFFGDGPRVPLVVVSPYSKGGHVAHTYADHVSILKFIERNWRLEPLSARSRDNLPNPIAHKDDPYLPVNGPAISDLFRDVRVPVRARPSQSRLNSPHTDLNTRALPAGSGQPYAHTASSGTNTIINTRRTRSSINTNTSASHRKPRKGW